MESPEPIKAFLAALTARDSSLQPQIEAGGEKAGNWWIDLLGKKRITIEWRPKLGFGFSSATDGQGYGEGPTEIFRSPERAAHRVMQLLAPEQAMPTGLQAMRELFDVTQSELANRLKRKQSAISRLERRDDIKIETINEVVRALGGKIEVRAIFPDSQFPIYQTAKPTVRKAHGSVKSSRLARA